MKFKPTLLAAALAVVMPLPALAADADLAALRAEFDAKLKALQADYEARLKQMEVRLTQAPAPAPVQEQVSNTSANPNIGLILQGRYHHAKGAGRISGFLPASSEVGSSKGFSLDASELTLGAQIDPYFEGYVNFAIDDAGVATEEAWVRTTALGQGLTLRAGRFLSGIGYANEQHPHAWDFANQNLAYAVMVGEHYGQDGVQMKWLAPTPMFLELGLELGQGAAWGDRNRLGSTAAYVHVGDDVGESHAWRAGLSYLRARADGREGLWADDAGVDATTQFTGRSRYWVADFVWKWAPGGNPKAENFKFQAEYLRRTEEGDLSCDDNTADGGLCPVGGATDTYAARQSGWYAQGVYQFAPRWRVGYRYDRLSKGTVDFGAGFAGILSQPNHTPRRHSLMLDYNPSEFSRLRLQLARDQAEMGVADHQVTLQYLHSLGPHGAHKF